MPDFHAYKYFMYNEEYFYPMGLQVEIVVNSATNLTLPHERERIQEIVHEFESTPHTMGSVATDFFLPEYLNYLKTGGIENVWLEIAMDWNFLSVTFNTVHLIAFIA